MIKVYNTSDNIYLSEDVKHAFLHAYNLGRSTWEGNVHKAYEEWENEYENNELKPVTKEEILKAVAVAFGTSTQAIRSQDFGKGEKNANSRIYAAWFLYMYIDEPLKDLCDYMGYQNHSSMIYAAYKLSDLMELAGKGLRAEIKTTLEIVKARLVHRGYKLKYVVRKRECIDQQMELI